MSVEGVRGGRDRDRAAAVDGPSAHAGRGGGAGRADRRRRYDIEVDLTDLLPGAELRCVSTISFTCREPGAATFVDCAADGESRPRSTARALPPAEPSGRIALPDLPADNILVVESRAAPRPPTARACTARSTRPTSEVYVWTSFEPDEAQARVGLLRPARPQGAARVHRHAPGSAGRCVSNSGDRGRRADAPTAPARRWTFPDTPPLSTYNPVVQAGPFHEIRREVGGLRPRPLRPPVAGADPRAGRRRAVHGHRAGPGVLRRALRDAVPAAQVRPGVPAGVRRRDGELRLRHVVRRLPAPRRRRPRPSASAGAACCCTRWRTCGSATSSRCAGGTTSGSTRRSRSSPATGRPRGPPTLHRRVGRRTSPSEKLDGLPRRPGTDHRTRSASRSATSPRPPSSFDAITYPKGASVLQQLMAYVGEDDVRRRHDGVLRQPRLGQHHARTT